MEEEAGRAREPDGGAGAEALAEALVAHGQHGGHEHARGVTPELRDRALARLRRIEGQVRGVHRMVEDERYCVDILTQISSIQEALRGVGKLLMRNHLEHCVTGALRSEDPAAAERAYTEVLDLMYRHAR